MVFIESHRTTWLVPTHLYPIAQVVQVVRVVTVPPDVNDPAEQVEHCDDDGG